MKKCIILYLLIGASLQVKAAKVDTVTTYSAAMKKNIRAVIITPDDYTVKASFPVVYLLHGYGGNYADWIKNAPKLKAWCDLYQLMIVCPDGAVSSWYMDSPVDPAWKYETYVTSELIPYIDKSYNTIHSRTGRAITGLSMGGHGAFYLAFRHQDLFGAAGSMSGGVDIRPFPGNWDLAKRLGTLAEQPQNWDHASVINLTDLLTPNSLSLIFDCGTEDFFYTVNKNLHDKLLEKKIPHDFIVRPGGHTWDYWRNSIGYQLLYMDTYFKKNN